MNWTYRKPLFLNITPLLSAKGGTDNLPTVNFDIKWTYPTNFVDPINTHDASNVLQYDLYRHIETVFPDSEADGGPRRDPAYMGVQSLSTNPPRYYKVTTLANTVTSYTDNFSDLSIHSPDGISLVDGRWIDSNGSDIIKDVVETKRRVYYKISAKSNKMIFNNLPFVFITHSNGYAECRSTIRQCKWNRLFNEGETVWVKNLGVTLYRCAVDPIYDIENQRTLNVWYAGQGVVFCVDGRNGEVKKAYSTGINSLLRIQSLRIDPDTGDAIVLGDTDRMWKCILSTGVASNAGTMGTVAAMPYGNIGLVINTENGEHKVYSIANTKRVVEWPLTSPAGTPLLKSLIGDTDPAGQVPESHRNAFGITNGIDQSIWVNGHYPYRYTYSSQSCYTVPGHWANVGVRGTEIFWDPGGTVCSDVYYDYWILKDTGYIYGVGQENYNVSSNIFTNCLNGRTYPCVGIANVEPTLAQYGLACDFPDSGLLQSNTYTYNIWQTILLESSACSLAVTNDSVGVSAVLNNNTWSNIVNPYHACIDSSNSVWIIQNDTVGNNGLAKIYQLNSGTNFPYRGDCSWPSRVPPVALSGIFDATTADYDYNSPYNNPFVEYVLTRTNVPVATALISNGGTKINGVNSRDEIRIAREWCEANASTLLAGTRVYPYYTASLTATFSFNATAGTGHTEFNSDNTGSCYINTVQEVVADPCFIRPAEVFPTADLKIFYKRATPRLGDSTFWDFLSAENTNNTSASGFDDLTIQLSANNTLGTFGNPTWEFGYDDKGTDIGGLVNDFSSGRVSVNQVSYKYNDPSISDKPGSRHLVAGVDETDGMFLPSVTSWFHRDPYFIEGDVPETVSYGSDSIGYETLSSDLFASSPVVSAIVWERWPTAEFFITPFEKAACRPTGWNWTAPSPAVGDNDLTERDSNRVVWGYDPVSAQFTDYSVARTWPLCAWYWDFGDEETFFGFTLPTLSAICGGPHVTSAVLLCSDPTFHPKDSALTTHANMINHFYRGAGTYYATLWVEASNTGTTSWNIQQGLTNQSLMPTTFTLAASRRIDVLEVCPESNFVLISGITVPVDYTDINDSSIFDVGISGVSAFQTTDNEFISGYAPNLTITWQGSAFPRSLPLSAALWDFSDSYNEGSIYIDSLASAVTGRYNYPTEVVLYPYPISGWPYWEIPGGYNAGTRVTHTFVMPGYYDVTLDAVASSVNFTRSCAPCSRIMHVYVEEILTEPCFLTSYYPTSGFSSSVKGGTSPFTIYFNTSCTIPGSFPICRLEYDFGDGTPIQTVSRLFSADYVFTDGVTAFPYDLADPRNVIVSHEFERTLFDQPSSLTVTVSTYACNTNTMVAVTGEIAPVDLISLPAGEGDVHLLMNRMYHNDNELMFVFESELNRKTYNVLLSSAAFME